MNAPIRAGESVIVFDLDDTLYAEFDYKVSGITAVCRQVSELYPQCDKQALLSSLNMQGNSWLDDLCDYCHFNDSEKAALLWQYRLHTPDIRPYMPSEKLHKLIQPFCRQRPDYRWAQPHPTLETFRLGAGRLL
jgi:putative hydrolase of the HAD superfamily